MRKKPRILKMLKNNSPLKRNVGTVKSPKKLYSIKKEIKKLSYYSNKSKRKTVYKRRKNFTKRRELSYYKGISRRILSKYLKKKKKALKLSLPFIYRHRQKGMVPKKKSFLKYKFFSKKSPSPWFGREASNNPSLERYNYIKNSFLNKKLRYKKKRFYLKKKISILESLKKKFSHKLKSKVFRRTFFFRFWKISKLLRWKKSFIYKVKKSNPFSMASTKIGKIYVTWKHNNTFITLTNYHSRLLYLSHAVSLDLRVLLAPLLLRERR